MLGSVSNPNRGPPPSRPRSGVEGNHQGRAGAPTGFPGAGAGSVAGAGGGIGAWNGGNGLGSGGTGLMPGPAGGGGGSSETGATDSITLGQLKAHTEGLHAKQKTQQYDFRYDDSDTIMTELDEFYPYIEMLHVAKNPSKFQGSFDGEWTSASHEARRKYIETNLNHLESPVSDVRRMAQGRILYLLQGCFAETSSPEEQLHWIMENAKIVRQVDGIPVLVFCLRDTAKRYNKAFANEQAMPEVVQISRVDPYDSRTAELMDMLAILYFMVEVFRSDATFGDELMAMEPPLPILLFSMVAELKDRLPKGYPVKKVLLLLWKSLLACLGGTREAAKAKALSRQLEGLGPERKDFAKATPMDIAAWRRDTSTKYPTFAPPSFQPNGVPVTAEKLADSFSPIPSRPNYHSTDLPQPLVSSSFTGSQPLPGTPAPSPPPSPAQKPKKQQYQTDPNRPFVFPYSLTSSSSAAPHTSLVPYAISEADKLYHEHAHVSLGLYQLWKVREECLREERGLGSSGLIGFTGLGVEVGEEDDEDMAAMLREMKFDEELEDVEKSGGEASKRNLIWEQRQASRRLHRVDVIYRATLPIMQSCVIVLLKLLLATVTGGTGNQMGPNGMPAGITSPTQENSPSHDDSPPMTKEEVDIARHREITAKAVSAVLILLQKWFKASHILKFHYFSQLLLDSNCLLLILKMFGVQEVSRMIATKNEWADSNFFRYCHLHCSAAAKSGTVEESFIPDHSNNRKAGRLAEGDENVELIGDFSWRNFFATINFVKVMQKMTKHRTHRILLLCQYKSTQILKRMLKVNQPMLQLQVLKVIKSQMPYCGRKWRSSNMKVITAIYLNCRPELRDEWLAGVEADLEAEDNAVGRPQELALRSLVSFYNKRHYGSRAPASSPEAGNKREDPMSADDGYSASGGPSSSYRHTRNASIGDSDVFPPKRSTSSVDAAPILPYNPDGMIEFWMHEYEAVLGEVFGEGVDQREDYESDMFGSSTFYQAGGQKSPGGRRMSASGAGGASVGTSRSGGTSGGNGGLGDGDVPGVTRGAPGPAERNDPTWNRLGEIMRRGAPGRRVEGEGEGEDGDGDGLGGSYDELISDSESVGTIGELGEDARLEAEGQGRDMFAAMLKERQRRKSTDNENTWEHMSPATLSLLPKSPSGRRRSSSGSAKLRPVITARMDSGGVGTVREEVFLDESGTGGSKGGSGGLAGLTGVGGGGNDAEDGDDLEDDEELDMRGPMPIERETSDERERSYGPVDEVEYAYGE